MLELRCGMLAIMLPVARIPMSASLKLSLPSSHLRPDLSTAPKTLEMSLLFRIGVVRGSAYGG